MIAIGEIIQETDSFNPALTTLADFQRNRLLEGQDILSRLDGAWVVDGILEGLEANKGTASPNLVISACAGAGGRISDDVLMYFRSRLLEGFRGSGAADTLFIALHGAMSSQSVDDTEGYLLQGIREEVGPHPFIALVLDHHANVTREMMTAANLVIGYETQPHDLPATGRKAAQTLLRISAEGIHPATAWRKIPMIAPQDRFLTTCPGPMQKWFDLARHWEQDPRVVAVSLFPMQPWLDVEQGGWSVVVHTTGHQALAEELADELVDRVWGLREEFWVSERVPPSEAVQITDADTPGLTVISDTGDAVMGGAPGDSTVLLKEMIEQEIQSTIFLPLVDTDGVNEAHRAGVGAHLTMTVGAGISRTFYSPLEITGVVKALSSGFDAETFRGRYKLGRTALIEIGGVKLVLTEAPSRVMIDPAMYTHVGLRMEDANAVVLKTGSNFQAFAPWRKRLVRADTPGVTQSRLQDFPWQKLPRPIFPLDGISDWR